MAANGRFVPNCPPVVMPGGTMLTQGTAVQGARCLPVLIVIMTRGSYHQWVERGIDRLSEPSSVQTPAQTRKLPLECHPGPKTPFCLRTISQPYYFQLKQCPDLYSIRGGRVYKRLQDISSHITFINICHNISRKSTVIAFAGPAEATGLSRRLRACPEWPQVA